MGSTGCKRRVERIKAMYKLRGGHRDLIPAVEDVQEIFPEIRSFKFPNFLWQLRRIVVPVETLGNGIHSSGSISRDPMDHPFPVSELATWSDERQ